jgi:hypothetical protein
MIFWPPIHGILIPVPMVYRLPMHGILTPLPIFWLEMSRVKIPYRGGQFSIRGSIYHGWELTSGLIYHGGRNTIWHRVRTHAVLVIGLYELLGNPTT